MKNLTIGILLGVILGGGIAWYLAGREAKSGRAEAIETTVESAAGKAKESVQTAATRATELLRAKWEALELRPEDVKEDLARTGAVVRRKAREVTSAIGDAAIDTAITAKIKAKLLADRELSAWDISVSTSNGRVTLSGTVSRPEQISQAMWLALETEGVREVVSTLRVKPAQQG